MSAHFNHVVELLNRGGEIHRDFAFAMFVQVSLLIVVLLALDVIFLRRLRAAVRYSLWMLVLVKLMLPVSLHTSVSVSRWMPEWRVTTETAATRPVESVAHNVPVHSAKWPTERIDSAPVPLAWEQNRFLFPEEPRDPASATTPPDVSSDPPRIATTRRPTSHAPATLSLHWEAFLLLVWAVVVAVLSSLFVRRIRLVARLVTGSTAAPEEINALLAECLQLTNVSSRNVRLRLSDGLGSPAICGFWRGTILLPSLLLEKLDRRQLRAILVHELVHWRRFDLQVNCLQTLLLIAYFYNPLVWIANEILRRSREQAVDEAVLAILNFPAEDYSTTLLDIASLSRSPAELSLRLVGVVESRKALSGRIKRILSRTIPRTARLGITGMAAVLIAGLVLLPMAGSHEPPAEAKKPPAAVSGEGEESAESATANVASVNTQPLSAEEAEAAEEAGITLIGQITDETGHPVTDAEVSVIPMERGSTFRSKTDEFGFYLINKLSQSGQYRLTIDSKRWVGMSYRDGKTVTVTAGSPNTQNFKLKRACQMRVRTVDEQGKPVVGVSLMANNLAANPHIATESVSTDAEGWVTLGGLAPAKTQYLIATMHDGYAYEKLILTLDDPEQIPEKEIVLRRGKTIKGTAVCSDGKPPSGWRILAEPSWWHFGRHSSGPTIGNDGSFILTNIVPGKYDVTISVPSGANGSSPKPVLQQANLFDTEGLLNVKMDHLSPFSLVYIKGHVKFIGQPKDRSFWIFADSKEPRYHSGFYLREGNTDFKIGPVPKGTYELEVQNPRLDTKPVTVTAPADDVEIVVSAKGQPKLTGRVIDADSKAPISRYRLRAFKLRTLSGPNYSQDPRWREIKNDAGNFEYEVHAPGVYKVQIAVPGYAWQFSDEINTVEDGDQPVLIALSEGVSLTGTVVDEAGNPIDGATVIPLSKAADVYSAISNRSTDEEGAVETANGKFELANLVPGEESVKVVHPDYGLEVLHHVAVGPERDGQPLRVTLNRGGTVRGRVFDSEGNPEPNVTLHFHGEYGPRRGVGEGALATVVTDADGFYEVQNLPEELCLVYRSERSNPSGVVLNTILPANGQTRTLDFGGGNRLTGRLLLNGVPLSEVDLILSENSPHSGHFRAFARTQGDGSFTFRGVPAGDRTLYYAIPGRQHEFGQVRTIEVAPQGADLGTIDHVTGRLDVRVEPGAVAVDQQLRVSLQVYNPIWPYGYSTGVVTRNPEDNSVTIEQVPPGKYELVCTHPKLLTFRKIVEVTPDTLRQTLTLQLPAGTASLSGRFDDEFEDHGYFPNFKLWSKNETLLGYLRADSDGSYRIENLPAGDYLVREYDTRDAHAIQEVTLQEGEQKRLDFTPDSITLDPVIRGHISVHPYTSGGLPLQCSPHLEGPAGKLTPSSSQHGRVVFVDKPGPYTLVVEYPGFETLRRSVELNPVSKDGTPAADHRINVYLQESR